jgi:hypothetical protein
MRLLTDVQRAAQDDARGIDSGPTGGAGHQEDTMSLNNDVTIAMMSGYRITELHAAGDQSRIARSRRSAGRRTSTVGRRFPRLLHRAAPAT